MSKRNLILGALATLHCTAAAVPMFGAYPATSSEGAFASQKVKRYYSEGRSNEFLPTRVQGGSVDFNSMIGYLYNDSKISCVDAAASGLCSGVVRHIVGALCPISCQGLYTDTAIDQCADNLPAVSILWEVGTTLLYPERPRFGMDCTRTRASLACNDPVYGQLCAATCERCYNNVPEAIDAATGGKQTHAYYHQKSKIQQEIREVQLRCALQHAEASSTDCNPEQFCPEI